MANETLHKLEKATLIEVKVEYLVFKSDNGCRTVFLNINKIIDRENVNMQIGENYNIEHINGKAKVTLI